MVFPFPASPSLLTPSAGFAPAWPPSSSPRAPALAILALGRTSRSSRSRPWSLAVRSLPGRGGVFGTFLGVVLVTALNNLLNFSGVTSFYQWVIQGIIIIAAVGAHRKK